MHRVDAVGNSPGVRHELAEGIGSLPGWRKGVRQKKTETRLKIVEDSRKACQERFTEGIGKLAGNTPGDRQKKTGRLAVRMSEVAGLARVRSWFSLLVIKLSDGCTAAAQAFRPLTAADPLRLAVKPPVPRNLGTFGG
ncbi:hypothetical protein BHE74_00025904 [Ensete ventricosum]|nr:hypothetical protein GW17_00057930 [Ensete ventricosum]RWW66713.1 hypothetical protein BHE74_00025904 [Ensete ventricosum]